MLTINLSYNGAPPATAMADFSAAAAMLEHVISDNITINMTVNWSGSGGGASAGPVSEQVENYSSLYSYLTSHASPGDTTFTGLNATAINSSTTIEVWRPELKLQGIVNGNDTHNDGSGRFSTDISQSLLTGVALHEFGHMLGRDWLGTTPNTFDLFAYNGTNSHKTTTGFGASYFSLNNGTTRWANWSNSSDASDFNNDILTPNDPLNAFYNSNTFQYLTPMDLEELDSLGYHLSQLSPSADSHDFNGDSGGDILLQNGSGDIAIDSNKTGSFTFSNLANTPGWTVVGAGKISGNLDADVVLQNGSQFIYGRSTNGAVSSFTPIAVATGYNAVGVGDVNRDLHADVVLFDPSTWQTVYANMANGVFSGWVPVAVTTGWNAVAVGDINGDGNADVVIQSGDNQIEYMNMSGGTLQGFHFVAQATGYNVVGVGDINRDGYGDIVLQDPTTSDIVYANMAGGNFTNWVDIGINTGYHVIAIEDVANTGYEDIVVENASNQLAYYNTTPGSTGWVSIGTASGYTGHTGPDAGSTDGSSSSFMASDPGPSSGGDGSQFMTSDPGQPSFMVSDPGPSSGGNGSQFMTSDPGPSLSSFMVSDPGPSSAMPQDPGPASFVAQDPGPGSFMAQDPGPTFGAGPVHVADSGQPGGSAGWVGPDPGWLAAMHH